MLQVLKWLASPVTGVVNKWQEGKQKEREARANLDRILTEAAANDSAVAGQIALVNAKNQNSTWKDEFSLVTIAFPFWAAMILGPLGYGEVVREMFISMSEIPEFWQDTFKVGILSSLGVTVWNKAMKPG